MKNDDIYGGEVDYETLKHRIAVARSQKEKAEKIQFSRDYVARCARRFSEAKARAPKGAIANVVQSAQSEKTRIAIAGFMLFGFAIWIGTVFYLQYSQKNEKAFAQKCANNNLSYSGNFVCSDEHGRVHTLNPDGTPRKGSLDWNVWRQTDFADKVANPDKAR
jgi:hypothetical protein